MTLIYEGTDMTAHTEISECTYTDCAGRCDTLHIELDNPQDWHNWNPKTDDRLEVIEGGIRTGIMYLQSVTPADGKYVIECSSAPSKAGRKAWKSYEGKNLSAIAAMCAGECGMEWIFYGIDGRISYPYLVRNDCGPIKFLTDIAEREGAVVKCCNNKLSVISVAAAGKRTSVCRISIDASQNGVTYKRNEADAWKQLTVVSGSVRATAFDISKTKGKIAQTYAPAGNGTIARRWAGNLIAMHNRKLETIDMQTDLNEYMGAMNCIEITGGTELDGKWIVEKAEHDLKDQRTFARLMRTVN